jgi:hypothetical protein
VQIGKDRHRAGLWLKNNVYEELKLIGDWHIMSVLVARYGWDIEKLREKAIDRPIPNTFDLVSVQEESLIVSQQKRSDLRMLLSKLPIKRLKKDVYNPFEEIKEGSIKYLYENKAIALHRWDYTDKNNLTRRR